MRGVFSKLRRSATAPPPPDPSNPPADRPDDVDRPDDAGLTDTGLSGQDPAQAPQCPLNTLRNAALPSRPFAAGDITPGVWLHHDPAMQVTGTISSPRGRLLELATTVTEPGAWCALHLALGPLDLRDVTHLVATLRTAAAPAFVASLALRSGIQAGSGTQVGLTQAGSDTQAGFHDHFFGRDILCQPAQTDHLDMLTPAQCPDIPPQAPWRELVIFLPPGRSITWSLHDLRWSPL